eukprot:scaffold240471_cov30-Tisochrysis_lutea.AAC.1
MTTIENTTEIEIGNTPPRSEDGERHRREESPPEIRITQEGEYYARIKGGWYEAEISYLGTPIVGR